MNTGTVINLAGMVDKVRAIRIRDQVEYLIATVYVVFDEDDGFKSRYGDKVVANLDIPIVISSGINPGDVVVLTMNVVAPSTQRFVPALEVGRDDSELNVDIGEDDVIGFTEEEEALDE